MVAGFTADCIVHSAYFHNEAVARIRDMTLLPHRGARVAQLTGKDMADLFQVMGALEGLAGELACARITDAAVNEIRARHHEMLAHYTRGDRSAYFAANQAIHEAIIAAADNVMLTVMY